MKALALSPLNGRGILENPGIAFGVLVLIALALIAVLAPWLGTTDPMAISALDRLKPASADHWFGTDMLGRDLYSRVIYGSRVSLVVGLAVAALSAVIGTCIGIASATFRHLDGVFMRVMDGVMSIPGVLLAIALMAAVGASLMNVIIAITIVEVPRVARTVRATVLTLREQPYVEASIISGSTTWGIIVRHYLPGSVVPLIVQATYICALAMVLEAVLSFIGAGIPPTIPSWGNLMSEGKVLWQIRPDLVFIPAAFLSVTVLAVNLLGDGLRDLLDPSLARKGR